jgi:murein L,D-transpeptidase YcbB/YkuD
MKKCLYAASAILLLGWWACKNKPVKRQVIRDTTINKKTSYNDLFLDSVQLEQFLAADTAFKKYEEQYLTFYKQRNYEYAWFDSSGLAEQARNFMNLQAGTIEQLQDSSLYNEKLNQLYESFANDSLKKNKKADLLKTELYLTGQFFAYAAKVYKGSDIDAAELGWYIPRKKLDLTALLDSVIVAKGDASQYAPLNPQYQKLQSCLVQYFNLQKAHNWDSIPKPAKALKKGDSAAVVGQIRQRLAWLGDMDSTAALDDSSQVFDSTLQKAVKSFQRRMGLSVDGAVGAKMIDELNTPLSRRIQQILVNMERVRWMPAQADSSYVLVNIPEYKLHAYDSAKPAFDMNVIVGTAANNTVIFSGKLQYVVFAPYWNVPSSIVQKEIVPGMQRDRNYLARHNMEITGRNGGLPDVRQKPGPGNSLGRVKFLFPNSYNIYLHDTPNHDLFDQSSRSFSHGCIRLSEPKRMAEFLLKNQPEWTSGKIDTAMQATKEKWVTVKKPVPVFIGYFTAWVDREGHLNFRKDIYGHDQKMADKLFVK